MQGTTLPAPVRCAIWSRVSTDKQATENQLTALQQLAAARGWEVASVYQADGLSAWTGEHREMLRQAVDDARAGKYAVLLVWALDRLERGGIEATLAAMRRFREAGAQVVSLQEPWTDVSGEAAELLTAVMGWVAQMESRRRSERIKAALAKRKAEGKPVGRQPGARDRKPRKRSGYVATWEDGGKRREAAQRQASTSSQAGGTSAA